MTQIVGKYRQTGVSEVLDEVADRDAPTLLREYRIAFGDEWIVYTRKVPRGRKST